LERNRTRDAANQAKLRGLGWNFLIIWECQLKNEAIIAENVRKFLGEKSDEQ
jgi:DNA mismatch endonuclease (patch repair protein)